MADSKGKQEASAPPASSRLKGNEFFRQSRDPGLAPVVRRSRLQQAVRCYRAALQEDDSVDEVSSNHKNIGIASYHMAFSLLPYSGRVENICEADRREFVWCCKEGVESFIQASQVGKSRDISWLSALTAQFDGLLIRLSEQLRNLDWAARLTLYAALAEGMRFVPRHKYLAEPAQQFFLRYAENLHMFSITLVDQANTLLRVPSSYSSNAYDDEDDEDDDAIRYGLDEDNSDDDYVTTVPASSIPSAEKKAQAMALYARCLALLGDSHSPLELSRPPGLIERSEEAAEDVIPLSCLAWANNWLEVKDGIITQLAVCESALKRMRGEQLLARYMAEAEEVNIEMVWTVADMYTESVVLARDRDLEGVLIAYSRIGDIYAKVLKNPVIAYRYHMQVVTQAVSLQPRVVTREEWYIVSKAFVTEERRKKIRREEEEAQKERAPYLAAMKAELDEIKAQSIKGSSFLLKHIYAKHPPKNPEHVLGCLDGDELKKTLLKAISHYHPDKAKGEEKKWEVLCEEITKYLTAAYSMFKGF